MIFFMTAIGFGGGFGNMVFMTGGQKYVPSKMPARHLSIDEVGSFAAGAAGRASGGFLIASLVIDIV